MSKTDPQLGQRVHQHLLQKEVETPLITEKLSRGDESKITQIEHNFKKIMETMGLDLSDDSLQDTPVRVAKMFVQEMFYGLNYDNFPKCTTVDNKIDYDELVIERATVKSVCEHHFVYFGTSHNIDKLGCYVAYMPNKKVLGLSKINRVVDFFSRRPQIQERLTLQIAYALQYILDTEDVAVVMKGQHFCVLTRGVQDADSNTVTSYMGGRFRTESDLRKELLNMISFK